MPIAITTTAAAAETTSMAVTTRGSTILVPTDTHIKRDEMPDGEARVKMLTDANCRGVQACVGSGCVSCSGYGSKYRYFIHGCCKPTDTHSRSTF